MSGAPPNSGGFAPRPPGMPPLPPGFKLPPGAMPPRPPGMPQMNIHASAPQPITAPLPPGRYPQPPPHLAPRPQGGAEHDFNSHHHHQHHHQHQQLHMIPPGVLRQPNDMSAVRDDRRPGMQPPADFRGYPPSMPYAAGGDYAEHRGGYQPHKGRREYELRDPTNTVWVGNLDPHEHPEERLRSAFSEFGRVVRVAKVPDKSYCFVHFTSVDEARTAVETLSARGSLGRARFNYGKMFEYTQQETEMPREMNNYNNSFCRGREDDRQNINSGNSSNVNIVIGNTNVSPASTTANNNDDRRRRPRREEEHMEPTNVLWLGELPPTISNDELNENFKVFGTIKTISRLDARNMAFIHFESVEECTHALELMRDQPIGGVRVALNYGRAQRNPTAVDTGLTPDGIPINETPTNVVYIGQLASDVTESDVEDLFEPFEGFINSKFIPANGIAFGHFDSIDHARAARVSLSTALLKGAPLRISFGKSNHRMTMADRVRRGKHTSSGAADDDNTDMMNAAPQSAMSLGGALVAGPGAVASMHDGGAVVALPAMGVTLSNNNNSNPPPPSCFARERPAPEMTLDARLQSLLGATYNTIGEAERALNPTVIQTVCNLVDGCVDEQSAKQLDDTMSLYSPLYSSHVFGILTRRMHEYYNDDPHKKLLILYAATRVLLGARSDSACFTKSSINAYLMTLFVASDGQTPSGIEMINTIIENLRRNNFLERHRLDADFAQVFRDQLDELLGRMKVEQDVASLLAKRRRK